jgi:uncharacterized protein (DUF302 family)
MGHRCPDANLSSALWCNCVLSTRLFKSQAAEMAIDILPNTMILFGAPEPGAKAMSNSPTLGLDAFCQKFRVGQDESGQVHLSYNDLLAIAERQGVSKSIALRVINYRLNKVFSAALQP